MAWIESHQTLRRHPKILHLCDLTKWSINEAVGVLHSLWWWTLDYAEDGDLKKFTSYQITLAIEAKIDPEILINVLIESKFIDKDMKIHDWWNYAGPYLTKKYHNNNPKKLIDIKRKYFTPKGLPKGMQKREVATPISSLPTNHNQPNQPTNSADGFRIFYEAYPRHVGKGKAMEAWIKLNPDGELQKIIMDAIEKQKNTEQWKKNKGQYIPYPATWLNGKRWEDEVIISKAWNEL